jgi:hypothetical protein
LTRHIQNFMTLCATPLEISSAVKKDLFIPGAQQVVISSQHEIAVVEKNKIDDKLCLKAE